MSSDSYQMGEECGLFCMIVKERTQIQEWKIPNRAFQQREAVRESDQALGSLSSSGVVFGGCVIKGITVVQHDFQGLF